MSIEIKISGDTPLEALSLVTAFGLRCQCDKDVYTVASRMLEAELTKEYARNPQPVADLTPAPVPAPAPTQPGAVIPFPAAPVQPAPIASQPAPVQPAPVASQPAAPVVPVAAAPSFTKEQIARAGSELISQQPGRMQELMGLLASYGVQAITDLKPEQLGPFATTLRGMGAKL